MPKQWDNLRVLTVLWALALIIHASSFAIHIAHPMSIAVVIVAVLTLWRSKSVPMLFALSVVQVMEFFMRSPLISNHTLVTSLFNLHIVIVIIISLIRSRGINRQALYKQIAVGGRILIIVLFAWAVFHKLNTDFFNPAVSCSVVLYQQVAEMYHLPQATFLARPIIWMTLAIELGIPVLLLFRRTRNWGILLGLGLHLFLGMYQFYDFGAMLYTLYFLFTAPTFLDYLAARHGNIFRWFAKRQWLLVVALIGLLLITTRWFYGANLPVPTFGPLWIIVSLFIIYLFTTTVFTQSDNDHLPLRQLFTPMSLSAYLLIIITVVNGFLPYIGLKTNNSFEMYSNLRSENRTSNHFLLDERWQIFDYTVDYAEIISTDDAEIQNFMDNNQAVTRFELVRRAELLPHHTTVIRYQGREYTLPQQLDDIGRFNPLLMKILTFDPIDLNEDIICSW